jgi:hypothetical protein
MEKNLENGFWGIVLFDDEAYGIKPLIIGTGTSWLPTNCWTNHSGVMNIHVIPIFIDYWICRTVSHCGHALWLQHVWLHFQVLLCFLFVLAKHVVMYDGSDGNGCLNPHGWWVLLSHIAPFTSFHSSKLPPSCRICHMPRNRYRIYCIRPKGRVVRLGLHRWQSQAGGDRLKNRDVKPKIHGMLICK